MTGTNEMTQAGDTYDYVIVGAGSAGSVLARRLSEDAGVSVLVLEAGGSDRSIIVAMPAALAMPMNTKRFNWGMVTEPEPGLNGRCINLPRGKGMGGSSSINGMCYVRGNPMDYELWEAKGATGWHWANVLPYFQKMEDVSGGGPYRGTKGPLRVTRGPEANPLYHAFVDAAVAAGYARSANMNEVQHEGFGPMEMTVGDGMRASAARVYLRPALQNPKVRLITGAMVNRILFEGKTAVGVAYLHQGQPLVAKARREVILSAGSIMSPVILKRSGIGPAQELKDHGIPVLQASPGVGENLMDHLELYVQYACSKPVSLFPWMSLPGKAAIGMKWLATRKGLGATNHFETGGHIRSRAGLVYPDIQFHFLPLAISYNGKSLAKGHGFQVHVGTKRSKSRGWVRLRDADAQSLPRVQFNYMTYEDDWQEMRACIRLSREIFAQAPMAPYAGTELAPGPEAQSDAALDDFIRRKVESAYHPCGTCRMGTDPLAVVDPDCRVIGVQNLRVVDASIMPQATAGDLNGPTIMLAERAADIIRRNVLPAATDAPIMADNDWQTRQRGDVIDRDYSRDRDALRAQLLSEMRM
ncbi:choline dehydrogenase [Yoonia sp.]|uniref:choline dehydrogenase n=1 Tax=Yoonia sp. TaxID=2212373 RepID=UPI0040482424